MTFFLATVLSFFLSSTAWADLPTCELKGQDFYLVLTTGSRLQISNSEFLKLALSGECLAPSSAYDCKIGYTRVQLRERFGTHCKPVENTPSSFDYYSFSMSGPEMSGPELFGTGTCYKVECRYAGENGERRMIYDNASYCSSKPSDSAIEKFSTLRQLGFCR